jgi:hypothetical protein
MTNVKSVQADLRRLTWVVNVIEIVTSHHDIEGFDMVTIDGKEVEVEKLIASNRGKIKAMTETKNSTRSMNRAYQDSVSKLLAFEDFKVKL